MFGKPIGLSLAALAFVGGCVFTSETEGTGARLVAPPAPFKKTATPAKAENFTPERKGNRVIAGNKEIEFTADGVVKYYADGRIVGDINLPFVIVDKKTGKGQWLGVDANHPTEFFVLKECGMAKKNGRDVYRKVFVKDGKKAECLTFFELTADGKVKLSYEWTQFDSESFFLRPSTLMFVAPTATVRNMKVNIDGAEKLIPGNASGVMFHRPEFKVVELFAGSPEKSIKISSSLSCYEFYVDVREPDTLFRAMPKAGQNNLSVSLDISRGVAGATSANAYAGIDFMAIENLEMPDYRASRNLSLNPSFESGLLNYHLTEGRYGGRDYGKERWESYPYQLDTTTAKFGNNSLRIKTIVDKFSDNRSLLRPGSITTWGSPVDAGIYTFSFYAKGDHPGKQQIKVWVPNNTWTGNIFVPLDEASINISPAADWQRYSFTFAAPKNMVLLANLSAVCSEGKGNVWIDGIQLEKGDKATAFETRPAEGQLLTSDPDNFLSPDMPLDARLKITATPNAAGKVKVGVKDFFARTLYDGDFSFNCDNTGVAEVKLPLGDKLPSGVFVVKSDYALADGRKCHEFFRFSIMDVLENEHRLKNIFSDNYGSSEIRPDFLRLLERWRKIGIGSKTHINTWDKIVWDTYRAYGVEPTDTFMMSDIRPYLAGGSKLLGFAIRNPPPPTSGLTPDDPLIIIRDHNFDNNGEVTEEYLAKLRAAVVKIARDNPWIPMWAFGGEVIARFPYSWWSKEGTREKAQENFARILKAFYQGVKEGNPAAKVFQDDPCNMSPEGGIAETGHLLAEVNKLGGLKFDMIGIHPYRKSPESPDLDADVALLLKVMAENGYVDTPVFFPEGMHYGPYAIPQWEIESARWLPPGAWYAGPLSYDMGWTEKISAAWRARSWLVALKYQDRVKAFTSSAFVNNFDMDMYLTPFVTQKISNTLGQLLGDAYFKKDIRFAPYVRCYVFEDAEKRPVAAVWCHHPKLDAGTMEAPTAEANFNDALDQVFDLMEAERELTPNADGKVTFPVSSFPLFFRGKPGTLDKFIAAFDNASLVSGEGISPLMISGKPAAPDKVDVAVKNYLSKEFVGVLENGKEKLALKVPPSGTTQALASMPTPLRPDAIVRANLPLVIQTEKSSFANDISFDGFVCRKLKGEIKIDGDLSDWKDISAINLKNRHIADKNLKSVADADFSGSFRMAWSEKGIYLCAEIKDDKFVHEEFAKAGDRWANDCLQIYFDSLCDARNRQQLGYDENDYDYALFPRADGKSSVVYRYRTPDPQLALATQAPRDQTIAEDIPSAFRKTTDGYVYEAFFPARYLLPMRLEKGYAVGFGLFAADRDDTAAKYPNGVKSALTLAPTGEGCYNKPHLWPAMLLWN